uniref:Uncharacterized protein n=1 Tax=Chromera velia CCMP2878 TaxID=1169474 RepID=A0A0G4I6U7_9ALVE|eukprot:Cvel_11499.t1-p1 / transcript=Cvel_11499.t1 / gene=Cvel_11499 / organism=Chromera_velia_CCMP2878 / gene_product=hypothetical protein / transcript_product=hypothetical protein / location=Cvel_scaffold725:14910-30696(+) / protein_length=258 / sequence_SO=supercontig / SO=protein_coding / is_pseudo=false
MQPEVQRVSEEEWSPPASFYRDDIPLPSPSSGSQPTSILTASAEKKPPKKTDTSPRENGRRAFSSSIVPPLDLSDPIAKAGIPSPFCPQLQANGVEVQWTTRKEQPMSLKPVGFLCDLWRDREDPTKWVAVQKSETAGSRGYCKGPNESADSYLYCWDMVVWGWGGCMFDDDCPPRVNVEPSDTYFTCVAPGTKVDGVNDEELFGTPGNDQCFNSGGMLLDQKSRDNRFRTLTGKCMLTQPNYIGNQNGDAASSRCAW